MPDRKSGVLLHISSLPGNYGIGDLGPSAYRFVDFLHQAKQSYWQVLPVNPTDTVSGHSPYSSLSAFAGNTLFISPQILMADGILQDGFADAPMNASPETVSYDKVLRHKEEMLCRAFDRFSSDDSVRNAHQKTFEGFVSANALWLEDYALFIAIKNSFNGKAWFDWPDGLRDRCVADLSEFSLANQKTLDKIKFSQYLFFSQWEKLKAYCAERGVRLFGDMAIYMNWDSADVWQYPQNYKLDGRFRPVAVAGVPPDYFSKTGQRWGNPVYDWDVLEANDFSWWVNRIRFNFKLFNDVRIDHFRGLVQYWEIPADEETAVNGAWKDVPTYRFFEKLQEGVPGELSIIAEDLGYITDDVREAMRRLGFPGMKILLFAFNGDMETHPYLPHNFKERCVVYTGTHDNNTTLGWFNTEATDEEKSQLEEYIGRKVLSSRVHWDLIEMAFASQAELAIAPLQDILGLGAKARMNLPATSGGENWRWRFNDRDLNDPLALKLRDLTVKTNRN